MMKSLFNRAKQDSCFYDRSKIETESFAISDLIRLSLLALLLPATGCAPTTQWY
jgi:hypothetical protein